MAVDVCPHCGCENPDRVSRGGLVVEMNPPAIYWHGIRYRLPTSHIRTLHLLVKRGRASYIAFEMVTVAEDTTSDVTRVRISMLRRWLRKADVPLKITVEYGWGYVLEDIT